MTEHQCDPYTGDCSNCGARRTELDDNMAPEICTNSHDWRTAWKQLDRVKADRDLNRATYEHWRDLALRYLDRIHELDKLQPEIDALRAWHRAWAADLRAQGPIAPPARPTVNGTEQTEPVSTALTRAFGLR